MYARIQTTHQLPDLARLGDTIAAHPGFAGLYALHPPGRTGRYLMVVTLWTTEDDARRSADRTHARLGPPPVDHATDLIYQVRDDLAGVSADETPTHATMLSWPGPMSEQRAATGARLRREHLAPAVLAVDGVTRMIAFFQPDSREPCLLILTTTAEAAQAARTAGKAIPLSAEEAAMFTPARIESYAVTTSRPTPTVPLGRS